MVTKAQHIKICEMFLKKYKWRNLQYYILVSEKKKGLNVVTSFYLKKLEEKQKAN